MSRDNFKDFMLDQLAEVDEISCRAMFGGYGLYAGEAFFGIIHDGRVYFKTNEKTRKVYEKMGMSPFRPNNKMTLKNYYEVPAEVIEDPTELLEWVEKAVRVEDPGVS
jgi:DNA transformation protein and related proteins